MSFSKFIKRVTFSTLAILAVPFLALAQVDEASVSGVGQELAQLNLGEAAIVGKTSEIVTVTFVLENIGTVPQSDIRYGAELVLVTDGTQQITADSFVSPETDSLAAGGKIAKVIEYPLAGIAPGSYDLWVTARTTGGLVLGLAKAGQVSVTSSDVVSFMTETCVLTIDGQAAEYHLAQGVDVSPQETLELVCDVKNFGATTKSIVPVFETFKRSVFGSKEAVSYPAQAAQTIAAGEQKTLTFALPKSTVPQAYEARIALTEEGGIEVVSNHVAAHYVLRGASATIQSINFDKASYAAGETISFSMFWTGSADAFFDSRVGTGTAMVGDVRAEIAVTDEAGTVCTSPISKVVSPGELTLTAVATTNCLNPKATISLVDASGDVLDNRSIEVKEVVVDNSGQTSSETKSGSPYMSIALVALALAALSVVVAVARHKKVDAMNSAKFLVLAVMAAGSLFGGAIEVEAATWNHRWSNSEGWHNHSVTVNTNKTIYSPNEVISLSSLIYNADCANNSIPVHRLIATLQGTTITLSENPTANTSGNKYGGGTFIAPATPGTYTIALRMTTLNRNEHSYANINITVAVPSVAAVGNFDSVAPSTCSVSGWAYDADSAASSIAVHVYRDQASGLGGTFVTACSANQPRADVNATYGITGNHGFNCALPASYAGTGSHNLYIHAIDTNGGPNNLIAGSPKAMSCVPPPPPSEPASISAVCAATSAPVTLSWPASAGATHYALRVDYPGDPAPHLVQLDNYVSTTHNTFTPNSGTAYTAWVHACNANGCSASAASTNFTCTVPASASITANGCSIALGNNSCQGTIVDWDIDNASSPNVYNQTAGTNISSSANGGGVSVTLPRGNTIVVARDGSTVLDSETIQAICHPTNAPYWNGTACTDVPPPPSPQISIDLDRDIVRSGETALVTSEITASYPTECTLSGVTATPIVFSHSGSPATVEYPYTTRPLTAAQQIVLTCEPDPAIVGVASATSEDRINVIPSIQEI